jgi:hypothetical protein
MCGCYVPDRLRNRDKFETVLPLANMRAATIGSGYGDKARQLLRQKLHCVRRDAREKKQEPRQ